MKAPERVETARLVLRRPLSTDAGTVFARYASDPEVSAFLSWPRHRSLEDTRAFLDPRGHAARALGVSKPGAGELRDVSCYARVFGRA